ncbi:DNA-directed RNA polymerase III subunit RPC3 [Rhagoletis pomonella]|uniref:DNA-directed RNA polymerase III subunit RPC3 n=1 Tax=Rhagoletis pomonella TaxID=28610 RepID=UPI001785D709|nr:DNA-directed RNA polymerase III subunit RPC3 [Rhagoletis pomonella]
MSIEYANLCSVIVKQVFGETVQAVADCLFCAVSRTLPAIAKTTKLSRKEVSMALAVLIKYQLVVFLPCESNTFLAEYALKREEIFYILRYPGYVQLIHTKYGTVGAAIAEELLHTGPQTATNVLLKCIANSETKEKIESYRDNFLAMLSDNYLIRLPQLVPGEEDPVPKLQIEAYQYFAPPEINLQFIAQVQAGKEKVEQAADAGIYWHINFSRFHQDFRDSLMIGAIDRKLGASASECFKYMLKQMYERTDPWQKECSNPFTLAEIKQMIEKKSNNLDLIKHLDQYVSLLADDPLGFIRKIGEMGGGQYVVDLSKAFEELTLTWFGRVITERYGSKASRIFRIIHMKKFIEQEDLQKEAMIPAREAKLLSYYLFQDQFIQMKTIRKAGGGGMGPAKAYFLFHFKPKQSVRMILNVCYKALYNTIERSNFEKSEHKRLIEKSQKLDSIVATMKERGESAEYIEEILETLTPPEREILEKVKSRIKTLSKAELTIDSSIFLLQMYLYHSKGSTVFPSKDKK